MGRTQKTLLRAALAALTLGLMPMAKASVFDAADHLFAARDGSVANCEAGIAEYQKVLSGAAAGDQAYAVQQIGRLVSYEAEYLLPRDDSANSRRAALYDHCRQATTTLVNQPAYQAQYVYWRMACSANWLKNASTSERLAQLGGIRSDFDRAVGGDLEPKQDVGLDLRYEGGGVERVLAAIYANPLATLVRISLPNGNKALEMANRALASRPYPGDVNGGSEYYRNYRQKAEALNYLQRRTEAQQVLQAAIDEITERQGDNSLPVGLEPETRGELEVLRSMLQQ